MHELKAITLEKVVYFKKPTRFEFKPGMTFIQGRNKQRRGPTASNGAGKSLLFGILPNLLLDTHAVVTKNAKQAQRQMYGAGSVAGVEFKTGKNTFVYTKAGAKTTLSKNGKDQKSRIARDQVKGLLQLSQEEFFATVYLDSRRPNTFQLGTSADRFLFITQLFRLHNIDDLRKHINRQLSELGKDSRVLDQTLADLTAVTEEIRGLSKSAESEAESISRWIKAASKQAQQMTALKHQHENYTRWRAEVAKLEKLDKPERSRPLVEADLKALDKYEARLASYIEQRSKQKSLKSELAALGKIDVAALPKMEKLRHSLDDDLEEPVKPSTSKAAASKLASKLSLPKASRLESKLRAQLSLANSQLATFKEEVGDADTCPTCHTSLSKATTKSVVEMFTGQQQSIEAKLVKVKRVLAAHKDVAEWTEYENKISDWDKQVELRARLAKYPFKAAKRFVHITDLLAELNPEKPDLVDLDRDSLETELKAIETWNRQKELASSIRTEKPEREVQDSDVDDINAKVEAAMSKLPSLQAVAAERKAKLAIKADLVERHKSLTDALADLPVYQMLSSSYSAKGIKVLLVQRIAKALEHNLNKCARQIFSEDFTFTFTVADGKFDVMVSRKSGKKIETSDIRHLSGAESRLFIFQFVLALLPLIPDSRRFNTLLLDEPDSNMDADAREIFRDSLLPLLAKVVPCLVIISPNSDIIPHHARVMTVVKDKGESRLINGYSKA